jgi:hypothetical protein
MEYPDMKQPWDVQAHWLVNYFQGLAEREGEKGIPWMLGLFMATHWMKLIQEPCLDLEEARLFLQALEAERPKQGTGWPDLWWRVKSWIAVKEQSSDSVMGSE